MVLTDFLRNLTSVNLAAVAEQARIEPLAPTQTISPQVAASPSFQKSLASLQNILAGGELPETFRESVSTQSLLGLGQASIDISQALSEQVQIREEQRVKTQEQIRNQSIALGQVNERLSRQVTELGESLKGISTGGFDPIKFFTDNPLIGGIGIGGLLVGGVVLLLVLR